jgi:hypothetical protein
MLESLDLNQAPWEALKLGSSPKAGALRLRIIGAEACLLLLCGCDHHQGSGGEGWHVEVFRALLREAVKSHRELEAALADRSMERLAWAARRFLELRIAALDATSSKKNAKQLLTVIDARLKGLGWPSLPS